MLALAALAAVALSGVPEACAQGAPGPAALVTVHGFRDRAGQLRIAVYPANTDDFLAPARYAQRLDTPLSAAGEMTVCAPVPGPGRYILVALHDRNADGRLSPFRDGVGFSRNPRLGLAKPPIAAVEVQLDGVHPFRIELNYLQGLRPAPVRAPRTR
jgi:uncharacterized protein (DUF2141 family)